MIGNWYQGNAAEGGDQYRGWLLGHFIDADAHGIRYTADLEVKWGIHHAGQARPPLDHGRNPHLTPHAHKQKWRQETPVGTFILERPGDDYIVWGPGINHTSQAERGSTMLTSR